MIRRILWLLLILIAGWLLRGLLRRGDPGKKPTAMGKGPASDGQMVRDRVCNTFVPKSRALSVRSGTDTVYFCSETCRRAFLQSPEATP